MFTKLLQRKNVHELFFMRNKRKEIDKHFFQIKI